MPTPLTITDVVLPTGTRTNLRIVDGVVVGHDLAAQPGDEVVDAGGRLALPAMAEAYARHMRGGRPAPVPVTVLQVSRAPLAPGAGRRMAGLADLACRTGGEYLFLQDQRALGALAEPAAAARLASRLLGTWRLTGASDLSAVAPGGHLATTRLRATLGGGSQSFAFDAPADADPVVDTRGLLIRR